MLLQNQYLIFKMTRRHIWQEPNAFSLLYPNVHSCCWFLSHHRVSIRNRLYLFLSHLWKKIKLQMYLKFFYRRACVLKECIVIQMILPFLVDFQQSGYFHYSIIYIHIRKKNVFNDVCKVLCCTCKPVCQMTIMTS